MIRLSIYNNGHNLIDGFTSFWDNIYDHLHQLELEDKYRYIDGLLAEWGGRVERSEGGGFVCFENERDATMFLLRWS